VLHARSQNNVDTALGRFNVEPAGSCFLIKFRSLDEDGAGRDLANRDRRQENDRQFASLTSYAFDPCMMTSRSGEQRRVEPFGESEVYSIIGQRLFRHSKTRGKSKSWG